MEIYTLSFLLGAILLLIALFGTGIEIRELKIRKVGTFARTISAVLGLFFIALGLLLSNTLLSHKPVKETPSAEVQKQVEPSRKIVKETLSTEAHIQAELNDIKSDVNKTIGTEQKTLDNGFEGDALVLIGWNIGDYFKGKTGEEGFQKVYIDKKDGGGGSNRSLAMNFQLGTKKTNKYKNEKIRARIKNQLNRDLSAYTGIRFHIKADNVMTVSFVLLDSEKDSVEMEEWFVDFTVNEEWEEARIPFNGLKIARRKAISRETNQKLELENTERLTWLVNERIVPLGSKGTIWLDEVAFYKD